MKFVSASRSAFMKAAGHPIMQKINDNAAKITAAAFGVSDLFLTSINYLKNGSIRIDMPPSNPDQWMSVSGLSYLGASALFMAGDKFNWIKKPVGLLSCVGAGAMAAAAPEAGWGLYLSAAAPMLTGLSMMFEDQANRAAESLSSLQNAFAKAGKIYLDYPIATMATIQMGSAGATLIHGIANPDQRAMIPYAMAWVVGNTAFALTDNNVRKAIRSAASPQPEATIS